MEEARMTALVEEPIWLCGKPRFLRETMAQVLSETFGRGTVREIMDIEPPTMVLPKSACWVIWFLNGTHDLGTALEKIVISNPPLNFVLIESDGHAVVQRSDQVEVERADISLSELITILKTTLDEWHNTLVC
jgi:hypothetical protein